MASSSSGITVGDLVALPHLRARTLAGHDGLDRRIVSACVPDARQPWNFVDPGDLVMTAGWIIPRDPAEQRAFIERLDVEGLSGLVVGEDLSPQSACPPLSDQMLDTANRLGFPILAAEYSVPWTHYVQAVAATQGSAGDSLSHIVRVHDEVRLSLLERRCTEGFVAGLGRAVGCTLYLVDPELWEPVLQGCAIPEAGWRPEIEAALEERGGKMPTVIRLRLGGRPASVTRIPVERPAMLLVVPDGEEGPRVAVLQHVAAACALEMARSDAGLERERRSCAELLSAALQGRLDANGFASGLRERGLDPPWLCTVIQAEQIMIDRLARRWAVRGTPHALSGIGSNYVAILQADEAVTDYLAELTASEPYRIGISDPFSGVSGLIDASRQARWALEAVGNGTFGLARYGNDSDAFLPRTLSEAARATQRILEPVLEYDRVHGTELVKTLRAYLECDRSPSRAAKTLFVHNQTVNYRISRIEELTGRSMRSTGDISELWYGLRALALSESAPSGERGARRRSSWLPGISFAAATGTPG